MKKFTKEETMLMMLYNPGSREGLIRELAGMIMRNAGLEEAQAGIKIAGRNISNLRYADDTTLMAESEEELKMKVKEESEKVGLKLNIQIMASGPIFMANRWGNSGNSG